MPNIRPSHLCALAVYATRYTLGRASYAQQKGVCND
jgi:hypothetical protein